MTGLITGADEGLFDGGSTFPHFYKCFTFALEAVASSDEAAADVFLLLLPDA